MTIQLRLSRAAALAGVAIIAGTALSSDRAMATETINLTIMDGYPEHVLWIDEIVNFFIPEVDRRLAEAGNYEINWTQAWAGQIVRPQGVLEGLENHLGDMAVITTVFYADRLPINNLPFYVPFASSDPHLAARIMDRIQEEFPEFNQQFEEVNQVVLTNAASVLTYDLFLTEPAEGVEDLAGRRINLAGINARYLDRTGAVPVTDSSANYYNNMRTGVVDGAMLWMEGAATFSFYEVAPYVLKTDFGTVVNKSLTANKDFWETLPEEVQTVMLEVAEEYRDRIGREAAERGNNAERVYAENGGTIIEMSDEDRAAWAESLPDLASEWVEDMESRGMPGREILSFYMDELRAAGETPLRDWDR